MTDSMIIPPTAVLEACSYSPRWCPAPHSPWTTTWTWGSSTWRSPRQTVPPRRAPWSRTHHRSCAWSHQSGWSWRCWFPWTSPPLQGCLGSCRGDISALVSWNGWEGNGEIEATITTTRTSTNSLRTGNEHRISKAYDNKINFLMQVQIKEF